MGQNEPTGFPLPSNPYVREGGPGDLIPIGSNTVPVGSQTETGRARFDTLMANAPGMFEKDSYEYNKWVLSLQEDLNDIEFTRLLRQAKERAQLVERQRTASQGEMRYGLKKVKAGEPAAPTPPTPDGGVTGTLPGTGPSSKSRFEKFEEGQHRDATRNTPIIQGIPTSSERVLGDPDNPGGEPDAFLQAYVNGTGLPVTDKQAQVAARSGQWVYGGQVDDPSGGKGYKRDLYVYVEDASAQLSSMPTDKIKAYQTKMGNTATGVVDPALQKLWDTAVATAANYARAGKKVTVQFIFDTLVAAQAASGGGGGGGRFAGETPNEMASIDYYRAMMEILGDISGVKS